MADLDRDIRIDTGLDRLDEHAVMACTSLERNRIVGHLHLELRIRGIEVAAMYCNPALITVDLDSLTLVIESGFLDNYAIVIFVGQVLVEAVSRRNDLGRAAAVLSESPLTMSNMCAPQSVM